MNREQRAEALKALVEMKDILQEITQAEELSFSDVTDDILQLFKSVDALCSKLPESSYFKYKELYLSVAELLQPSVLTTLSVNEQQASMMLVIEAVDLYTDYLTKENIKKDIVFLPYKASMWDSMESIWLAAQQDSQHCNTYVIPIPYCDRKPDLTAGEWHCEKEMFPAEVPTLRWQDYSIEVLREWRPDVIVIHNPYDGGNTVTSVDSDYYSHMLKQATDFLVYVPYYSTTGGMAESQQMCPAYKHVDAIIVQAEQLRCFFDESVQHKVYPFGSPKFDKIIRLCQNPPEPPEAWKDKIKGKTVYFFNTSLGGLLYDTYAFLRKMAYVFNVFRGHQDACLLWRPHPLLESTLSSMRPYYLKQYKKLKAYYLQEEIGIFDTTPDIEKTIALADAYIGDAGTSVTSLFGVAGKPMFILNNQIHEEPQADSWKSIIYNSISSPENQDWLITWNNKLFHAPNHDRKFEFYCQLRPEASGDYYNQVFEINDKIYVCPANGKEILVLKDKKIIKKLPLDYNSDKPGAFWCTLHFGNKLIVLPWRAAFMACVDLQDDTVAYFHNVAEHFVTQNNGEWFVGGSCVWRDKLILASPRNGTVLLYDKHMAADQEPMKLVIDSECTRGFLFAVPEYCDDGEDNIWFLPVEGQEVVCWTPTSGRLIKYTGFPEGFVSRHIPNYYDCAERPLHKPMFTKDKVYFPPFWGNMFLCLDRHTGEFSEWKVPFETLKADNNTGYFYTELAFGFWQYPDDKSWWFFHALTRKLYRIDSDKMEFMEMDISFTEDALQQLPDGFAELSDWLKYGCEENCFNSLERYLTGDICGCQPDKARQLQAYSQIANNNDGTAGQKIYDFIMQRK